MIQWTWNILSFKLHFQNFLKVIQSLLCVLYVGWQVAVHETERVPKEGHADADSSFVPLAWKVKTFPENALNACKCN